MKVEGPDMKEGIQDSFRQWYMEYKRVHGKLPDFPPEEVWQDPNFQFLLPQQVNQAAAAADSNLPPLPEAVKPEDGAAAEKKGAKGAEKNKGAKPGAKKGKGEKEEEVEESFKFDNSEFLTEIKKVQSTYENNWQNKDETENFAQKHDQEIIKILKRKEVEAEIKSSVMEILKEELKNLKSAVEKDSGKGKKKGKGGKGKKSAKGKKKGGKKGGKGKKEKKGKKGGKKGKKEKDLTANRTMESLIEELVQTGILQKVPKLSIDEFKGEHNLFGNLNKSSLIEPTLGELQRLVCEYCILPLGFPVQPVITEQEKEVLPKEQVDTTSLRVPSIPTVMFFGAKGTGKTSLVNAIASEAGAHIFNLTPKNTAGQFVGKPNVTKMVHMVFKVAKAQAPSIIYIDNIELIFAKKIPKDDQTDPKRIKKDLLKNLKSLTNLDRVILIGSTSKPWEAELKVILPIFEKFIFCPKPDYTSRFLIWRDFIQKKIPNITNSINVSLLARMSSGMSTGSISLCCDRAMTNRRMKLLRNRPLVTNEFVDQIINMMPLAPEEDKLFQDWYEKTPMIRKRLAAMVVADPEEDKNKKKQLKAPPKKK
ncbi:Dynein regulatory complex protein 11 [Clydaea vesicula]|uniref:Dynein regulatory complex protein 11 n=1 Tax=Clydaea vesicula TaxID=447962 RepID=A0AAD5XZU6_9FUNG|nr:Dynein regulatory complex protein 11 [Clydaea vesicula]